MLYKFTSIVWSSYTFRLDVDESRKQKLGDMGSKNQVQCVQVVESAGGNQQLLIGRRRLVIRVESGKRQTQCHDIVKHVIVEDAALFRLLWLTTVVVTHKR